MSDTPTPKTASQSEAFLAIVEAIGDALYTILSDDTFTQDEAESLGADLNEVGFLAFDIFNPQIVSTSTGADGSKKFLFEMTVPEGDMYEIIQNLYRGNDDDNDAIDDEDEDDDAE